MKIISKISMIAFFALFATLIFSTPESAIAGTGVGFALSFMELPAVAAMNIMGGVNPATQKMARLNNKFGIGNANTMQGTTREIWDSLLLPNNTELLTFFRECGSRQFPDTNLTENGNKLNVGDTLAVQGFYIQITERFSQPDPETDEIQVDSIGTTKFQHLRNAEFNLYVGNSRVVKDLSLAGSLSVFNRWAQSDKAVFLFDNPIIITQQIQFYATIRIPTPWVIPVEAGAKDRKMKLTLTGMGGIINLKSTI